MDYSYGIIPYYQDQDNQLQFLIIQHIEGHRSLPKGHKEKNETDRQTAVREFQEETGINIVTIDNSKTFTEQYSFTQQDKTIDKQVIYFLGQIKPNPNIQIQEEEITNYKVASFNESIEQLSYQTTQSLLTDAYNYLCAHHK